MFSSTDIHSIVHIFDPSRLTLARELRGLTKTELAQRIEKTPSSISQFESSRARPDAQTVSRLALALGLPATFFAKRGRADVVPLDACFFRSLRSASQKDRRRLLALGSVLCELVSFLETHVDVPPENVTPVMRQVGSTEDIEACATSVRRAWGLGDGPLPSVVQLLELNGVVVLPISEACREVDAFSLWHGERPCVFLLVEKGSTSRTRFDAAHELGHLVMHADAVPGNKELERQANKFASSLLLPREPFLAECPRWLNWDHLLELKRRWKVSLAALVRRAFDLELYSEATYRRACIQLNQMGRPEPHEPPEERPEIVPGALHLLADDWPLDRVAGELAVRTSDLEELVGLLSNTAL